MATNQDVIDPITIDKYQMGAEESAVKNTPSLGFLKEKGNWEKEDGGEKLTWQIMATNRPATIIGDYESIADQYVPHQDHEQVSLDWGQVGNFDALSKVSMKKNGGEAALVKFRDHNIPHMLRGILSQGSGSLNDKFYNGVGSDGSLPYYGLASFMLFDTGNTSTQEGAITAGSTYAGKSIELSGLGIANAEDDAWSPTGINVAYDWDGTGGSSGTLTTAHFPLLFDYAGTAMTFHSGDERYKPDCVMASKSHFNIGRNFLGDKQRIVIDREGLGGARWGHGNSVETFDYNGLPFYWDDTITDGESYMLNFDQIGFCYLPQVGPISGDKYPGSMANPDAKLVQIESASIFDTEVSYNPDRLGVNISSTVLGQFRFHPRYQAQIKSYA